MHRCLRAALRSRWLCGNFQGAFTTRATAEAAAQKPPPQPTPVFFTMLCNMPVGVLGEVVRFLEFDERSKASLAMCNRALHAASKTWSTRFGLSFQFEKRPWPDRYTRRQRRAKEISLCKWLRARQDAVEHVYVSLGSFKWLHLVTENNRNSLRTVTWPESIFDIYTRWPAIDLDALPRLEGIKASRVKIGGVSTALTKLDLTREIRGPDFEDLVSRLPALRHLSIGRVDPPPYGSTCVCTSVTTLETHWCCLLPMRMFPNLMELRARGVRTRALNPCGSTTPDVDVLNESTVTRACWAGSTYLRAAPDKELRLCELPLEPCDPVGLQLFDF